HSERLIPGSWRNRGRQASPSADVQGVTGAPASTPVNGPPEPAWLPQHTVPCGRAKRYPGVGSGPGFVRPGAVCHDAVAAFWLGTADRDDLEPVGTGLKRADDLGGDTDYIPATDIPNLVV